MPVGPLFPDFRGEHWPEPVPPEAHRLMANIDAALMEQVLDVSKRERKPNVHHHRQDNFGRGFEIAKWLLVHLANLAGIPITSRLV